MIRAVVTFNLLNIMISLKIMLLISLTISALLWCTGEGTYYKNNETDFSKCKVYYCRHGNVYKDFFEIEQAPQNDTLLDFHFSVMAPSDAHILLAPSSTLDVFDPVYEIVIGAGGNTFCDIRRMQKAAVTATVRIKGLLSALDPQSFWIHIRKDGVIEVGKEGEELSFLSWQDPDPLPLKVFSFSTWPGIEAKWFFDCPREDNSNATSKEIERPLTPLERLRRDLLLLYDPYVRPVLDHNDNTEIGVEFNTTRANLNEHLSVMHLAGTVVMTWKDQKLNWNSSDYHDINEMHIFRREIWVPHLFLFNSVSADSDILEDTMLTVNSSGFVRWFTNINMYSWCSLEGLGSWPRDEHSCSLLLGFYRDFNKIQLLFNLEKSNFECPYCAEWTITKVETTSNPKFEDNETMFEPPNIFLQINLRRTSDTYTILLFTPFFVIAVALLITFWSSPFGTVKISMACLQLVISAIVLIVLGVMIPIHSQVVPKLVLLYSYSLVAGVVCIIVEVMVINLSRNIQTQPLPHIVSTILLSCFMKIVLLLPDVKSSSARYGQLSTSSKSDHNQDVWILLGVAIDRIAFFMYMGLAVYAFSVTY